MMEQTYKVVFVRSGESRWKDFFCGWHDAKLTPKGKQDALTAGKALKDAGYEFDVAHNSLLIRAQKTLTHCLDELQQTDIQVFKSWKLNGRHYGNLTGTHQQTAVVMYGEAQVAIWRDSFNVPPQPIYQGHPFYEKIIKKMRNASWPATDQFPMCESLETTFTRVLPYWNDVIVPQIRNGRRILISAHGSSLRAIIQHLEQLSNEEILGMVLPSGIPFVYELNEELKPIENGSMQFVGDEETVNLAKAVVARPTKCRLCGTVLKK